MKFVVYRTTDDDYSNSRILNFNTVEELINFQKKEKHALIIQKNWDKNAIAEYGGVSAKKAKAIAECDYSIEIYDGYRE